MSQNMLLPKGIIVKVGGIKMRLEHDIEFSSNDQVPAPPDRVEPDLNLIHWRNFVKVKIYFRGDEEIRVITSKYREYLENVRCIDYFNFKCNLPGYEWQLVKDIHIHGWLFPKYRLIISRKITSNEEWSKKDMKYLAIVGKMLKDWAAKRGRWK